MTLQTSPGDLKVNDDLEEARPIDVDQFESLMERDDDNGNLPDDIDLTETQREFWDQTMNLAQSIRNMGQISEAQTIRHPDNSLELVTGYRRFLACKYIGRQLRHKTVRMTDENQVNEKIYAENIVRHDLDPKNRAMVIAKRMGIWDEDSEQLLSEEESPEDAMTMAEFADKTGMPRGTVYHHLSPLRQNQDMRDDFGDEICETSFGLIERISETEAEQYTIAQCLCRSHIDTHQKFEQSVKVADNQSDNQEEFLHRLCRSMIGNRIDDDNLQRSHMRDSETGIVEKVKKHKEELESQEKTPGQTVPDPDDFEEEEIDINIADPDVDESGVVDENPETGVGFIEPEYTPSDDPISVELTDSDVAKMIRKRADERGISESEWVERALESHGRREGFIGDIPQIDQ